MLELDNGLEFDLAREEEFFAALPARPAVFVIEPHGAGGQPYLARTADLRRAADRLLRTPEQQSKRLNLREITARIRYRLTGSRFEQSLTLYQHARARFPLRYRDFLRLRPPALLKVNLRNEYPRCYVTRRIFSDGGAYFGPFPSRKAAETLANEFLDLFKMRRCQIKIRRDPSFPGCIYSEMKMCLAPCFAGCSKQEYDAEVGRVLESLASGGAALTAELGREREAASEALDFERAAQLHKKIEKISGVLRGLPELAQHVDELDAVILQPAAEENAVAVFAVHGGFVADPFLLRFLELSSQPRSVEEILRQNLKRLTDADESRQSSAGAGHTPPTPAETAGNTSANTADSPVRLKPDPARPHLQSIGAEAYRARFGLRGQAEPLAEHLALLARWYYSKPREGEIFFPDPDWPYRRIIRACSRLLNPPAAPSPSSNPGSDPGRVS